MLKVLRFKKTSSLSKWLKKDGWSGKDSISLFGIEIERDFFNFKPILLCLRPVKLADNSTDLLLKSVSDILVG